METREFTKTLPPLRKFSGWLRIGLAAIPFALPMNIPAAHWDGIVPDTYHTQKVQALEKRLLLGVTITETFTTPGTTTFTMPADVTTCSAISIAGGGGGANGTTLRGGGGGAGGSYAQVNSGTVVFDGGDVLTIVVGSGGTGGGTGGTQSGTASQITDSQNQFTYANLGLGSTSQTGGNNSAAGNFGDVTNVGGHGGAAVNTASGGGGGGGGTGASAGAGTAGGAASLTAGGTGGGPGSGNVVGGTGGTGGNLSANATAATGYGAGGAGGGAVGGLGSSGTQGYCSITYTTSLAPTLSSASVNGTAGSAIFTVPGTLPMQGTNGFSLSATGSAVTMNSLSWSSATLSWTNSRTIAHGETVTISYNDATGNATDSAADPNYLGSFTNLPVTNSTPSGGGGGSLPIGTGMMDLDLRMRL